MQLNDCHLFPIFLIGVILLSFKTITIFIIDVPGVPSVPEVSEVFKDSCQLSWQPPASDGGAPISAYIIEKRSGTRWVRINKPATCTNFKVTDLNEDSKYDFRVIAENKVGCGPPSQPSQQIHTKDPWGKHQ